MSNQNINGYDIERFSIGDDDYFDIDWLDGSVYKTAKVKGSVIKSLASGLNIYNTDGKLTGDRIVDADLHSLTFDNLRKLVFNINTAPLGSTGLEMNIQPTGALIRVRDAGTNDIRFEITQTGNLRLNNAFQFPLVDGLPNQILVTDGSGNLSWETLPNEVNLYNSNGALTSNRIVGGSFFDLWFLDHNSFIFQTSDNGTDIPNGVWFDIEENNILAGGNLFKIRKKGGVGVGVDRFRVLKNGQIEFNEEYKFPLLDGNDGDILQTDGSGNVAWSNINVWKTPQMNIFDALGSGGLTTTINASGAGFHRYFNGTGTAGRLSFNIGLLNALNYDGSSFKFRIQYQIFGTNNGGNVTWQIDHKFVTADGTTNAETTPTTTNVSMNITGLTSNVLYEFDLITLTGTANAQMLMLNLIRNTGGGSNNNIIDLIGVELIKI